MTTIEPMPVLRQAALVLLAFLAAGCAATTCYNPPDRLSDRGDLIYIDGVRAFEQGRYRCGPAALASMLAFSGIDVRPEDLEESVFDPGSRGTLQASLVAAAARNQRVAYEISGFEALRKELSAGNPVLVLLNKGLSWWPVYHYAVVSGFDRENRIFIIAGGRSCQERVPESLFRRMWSRADQWGLLILKPQNIPSTAIPDKWTKAVSALERTCAYTAALSGYEAALEKWPESAGAMMGKANALYSMGRLGAAAGVLAKAAVIHPESGPILNNLAHVLLESGRPAQALGPATRAAELGGPHEDTYRKTLENVKKAMGKH